VKLTPLMKASVPLAVFNRAAGWLGVNTSMRAWRGRGRQ
jgi:hypothetical protein